MSDPSKPENKVTLKANRRPLQVRKATGQKERDKKRASQQFTNEELQDALKEDEEEESKKLKDDKEASDKASEKVSEKVPDKPKKDKIKMLKDEEDKPKLKRRITKPENKLEPPIIKEPEKEKEKDEKKKKDDKKEEKKEKEEKSDKKEKDKSKEKEKEKEEKKKKDDTDKKKDDLFDKKEEKIEKKIIEDKKEESDDSGDLKTKALRLNSKGSSISVRVHNSGAKPARVKKDEPVRTMTTTTTTGVARAASAVTGGVGSKRKASVKTRRTGTVRQTMPSDPEEVKREFEQVMELLKVADAQRVDMRKMSLEAQWMFVLNTKQQFEKAKDTSGEIQSSPQSFVGKLMKHKDVTYDIVRDLRNAIKTQTGLWIDAFRETGGVKEIVELLKYQEDIKHKTKITADIQLELLLTIQQIIVGNRASLELMLLSQDLINKLSLCSRSAFPAVQKATYEFMAILLDKRPEESHQLILNAFDFFAFKTKETQRFVTLVGTLKHEEDNDGLWSTVLTLINCLVNIPENLDDRIEIRNEFFTIGIEEVFASLKDKETTSVEVIEQVKSFEEDMKQDEEEFRDELETANKKRKGINMDDPESLWKGILERVSEKKYLRKPMVDILRRMLVMPTDNNNGYRKWLIIEKLVHQLSSSGKEEIRLDFQSKIDLESLLLATDDRVEIEKEREQFFEKKTAMEHELANLKRKYSTVDGELKEAQDKLNNLDREMNKKLQSLVDERVEELIKFKTQELNEKSLKLEQRDSELAQKTTENYKKIEHMEDLLKSKNSDLVEIQNLFEDTKKKDEEKMLRLTKDFTSQIDNLNEELQKSRTANLSLQSEIDRLKIEQLEVQRIKLASIQANLETQHKQEIDELEKSWQAKMAETRTKHQQAIAKSVKEAKEEHEAQNAARKQAGEAAGAVLEEKLVKQVSLLNERKAQIDKLSQTIEELNADISQKDKSINDLNKSVETTKRQLEEERTRALSKSELIETERQRLDNQLADLRNELQNTKQEFSHMKQKQKLKKAHLKESHKSELSRIQAELAELKRATTSEKDRLTVRCNELSSNLEKERAEYVLKRQQQEDAFIAEKAEIQKQMISLTIKLDDAEHNIEVAVGERLKIYEVDKIKLSRQVDQLKQSLTEQQEATEVLKKQREVERDKLVADLVQLRESYNNTLHEKTDLTEQLKKLEAEVDSLKRHDVISSRTTMLAQIEILKEENETLKKDLQEMERDLNTSNAVALQTKIEELIEELDTVKEECEASKAEVEKLTKKRNEQQDSITELTKVLDIVKGEATRVPLLTSELAIEREGSFKAKEEVYVLQSKLDKANQEISKYSKEYDEIKTEKDDLKKKFDKVQIDLMESSSKAKDLDKLKPEHEKLQTDLQNLKNESEAREAKLARLKSELDEARKAKQQIENDLEKARASSAGSEAAKTSISKLNDELSKLKKDAEEAKLKFEKTNETLSKLEPEAKQLKAKVTIFQKRLDKKDEELKELEKEKKMKILEVESLESDVTKLQQQNEQLKEDLDKASTFTESDIKRLNSTIEDLQADGNKIRDELRKVTLERSNLESEIKSIRTKNTSLAEETDRLKEQLAQVKRDQDRGQKYGQQVESLKEKVTELTSLMETTKSENIRLQSKIAEYKVKIEDAVEMKANLDTLQTKSTQLEREKNLAERKRRDLEQEKDQLSQERKSLIRERDQLMVKIGELKELQQENEKFKKQIETLKSSLTTSAPLPAPVVPMVTPRTAAAAASKAEADAAEIERLRRETQALTELVHNLKSELATRPTVVSSAPPTAPSNGAIPPAPQETMPSAPSGGPPPPPPPLPVSGGPPPPPPPMAGGGPPPPPGFGPPPPMAGKPAGWRGPKPKVPMRNLQWAKMPKQKVAKSIFSDMKAEQVSLDTRILEELFCKTEAPPKKVEKEAEKPAKEVAFSVLDPKKQQNVGIFMKTLKISHEALEEAILTLNEDILTTEMTLKLLDNLPDDEDTQAIKNWLNADPVNNKLEKMSGVDQYFYTLSKVPQVRLRLESFNYKLTFEPKCNEVRLQLLRVKQAITLMKSNAAHFHKLMEIILALGNFLNSGTANGNADAFSLRSLSKLADAKSQLPKDKDAEETSDKPATLLHYLIQFVEKKFPEVCEWTKELGAIKYATKLTWDGIVDDVSELRRGLKGTEEKISKVQKAESRWDVFYKLLPLGIEECKKQFEDLEKLYSRTTEDFKELVTVYGEDPITSKPEEFFGTINDFLLQYEDISKELKLQAVKAEKERKKREIEEKKEQKRRELEEKRQKIEGMKNQGSATARVVGSAARPTTARAAPNTARPTSTPNNGNKEEEDNGDEEDEEGDEGEDLTETMDNALSSIKSGRTFQKRRLRRQDTLRQKKLQAESADQES